MIERSRYQVLILILLALLNPSCLEDVEEVPLTPQGGLPDAPTGLLVTVGDGVVDLSWDQVDGAVSYNVYRKGPYASSFELNAGASIAHYTDTDVTNGLEYAYRVSTVVQGGTEGEPSMEIRAVPAVFSIQIAGGSPVTGSRTVVLSLTAPSSTVLMRISNESSMSGAEWQTYAAAREWLLSEGDGVKTVYAAFQDNTGSESAAVSSTIELDTYAGIASISILEGDGPFTIGQTVHFSLEAEDAETGGEAWLELEGLGDPVELRDDGRGGDSQAGDGTYQREYTFPVAYRGTDLGIAGQFTDMAGNTVVRESSQTISFTDRPEPVVLLDPMETTNTSVTLKWVESTEPHFLAYRIYRATSPGVSDQPEFFVRGLDNRAQTSYPDTGLDEAVTYYYRIYVVNDMEEVSISGNELEVTTEDLVPTPVLLDEPSAVGTDRLTLTWSVNNDTDFQHYEVRFSTSPGVTVASTLIGGTFEQRDITWLDHTGIDLVANTYYYRVFVYDKSGNVARSNEVSTN